ncbi:MAG: hypothetical protein JRJ49_08960, partial [Deltaproteobacteria bacterium]|nr:hypothetical protein [Deltaproteobacteria bacterium]
QAAWGVLGWNEENWTEETNIPESEGKTWVELSDNEKAAVTSLGYTDASWTEALLTRNTVPVKDEKKE